MFKNIFTSNSELSARQTHWLKLFVNITCVVFILVCISVCIHMYLVKPSLWLDEAMLAFSISQRSLTNLTSTILDHRQSAPVVYLYIVKIITLIFGDSETTLRVFSLLSYLLTLVLGYYLANKVFKIKYAIVPVAFMAGLAYVMNFSNELKPYMSDCMSVFLVLVLYYLFSEKRIKYYLLIAVSVILIWFSNPVCFFIGAILLYEFIDGLKAKDYKKIKLTLLAGIVVLISFVIYYFYWLKLVVDAGEMHHFWMYKHFPLIPKKLGDILLGRAQLLELIIQLGEFKNLIFVTVLLGLPLNYFFVKNKYVNIIYLALFITLFASWLTMFPLQDRMCLFIYPIFILLFFFFLSQLYTNKLLNNILLLVFSFVIIYSGGGIEKYTDKENIYFQETDQAVEFIERRIGKGDVFYVHESIAYHFSYLKKFVIDSPNYKCFMGGLYWDQEVLEEDMSELLTLGESGDVYILTGIDNPEFILMKLVLDRLKEHGEVTCLYNKYNTAVYLYQSSTRLRE